MAPFPGVEAHVSADAPERILETYLNIVFSFSRGVVRIWSAESAAARLLSVLNAFRSAELANVEGPAAAVLQPLARVSHHSVESLVQVTNVSHLVYAASLLDMFLSETVQFLFLLIPRAMGENQQVPLRALIDAPSKNEAITQAAVARTHEISERTFAERIQFLRETFGLEIKLTPETAEELARFSSVRDSAVRDQGKVRLDGRGNIISRRSSTRRSAGTPPPDPHSPDPRSPEKLGADEVRRAIDAYEQATRAIAAAVFTQILRQGDHPAVQLVLKGSTAQIELRPS
jgi:hypothetical protein